MQSNKKAPQKKQ